MDNSKANAITQELMRSYDEQHDLYSAFCVTSADLIRRLLEAQGVAVHSISFRCKDRKSLERKINKKNKYKCISDITDLVGVRVITHYSDDVDVVAKIIEKEFTIDSVNSIDKRASLDPDRFGYLSLHYVASFVNQRSKLQEYAAYKGLKLEIQIRSILQHTWAEIEHDIGYKSKYDIPDPVKRKFSRLAGLLELADQEFISIRTENHSYAQGLDEALKSGYAGIGLDVVSFEKFLQADNDCRRIMDKFKEIATVHEIPYTKDSVLIQRLGSFGIEGIERLHELLCENESEILRLFEEMQKLPNDDGEHDEFLTFSISAPVFYLCHILASKMSEHEILKYIQVNGWFTEASGEEFLDVLVNFNGVRQVDTTLDF
ncbi:GTP pyrophosphokinase [Pseudomonas entomophila]|uniref:RelA/SpoT domain-containing protein n=1 Tax=Pseudomonas entomophila TaxID=312306 RepID=A0ABY9QM30_9PSED|nr:hypothetical protein [Pseudomonas entomophila]WMW04160.1 hypothetical protein RAH46_17705 [Pseudomonas entomophila]